MYDKNKVVYSHRQLHKPEPKGRDDCQSPPYAILPLIHYLPKDKIIWEPANGEGLLSKSLIDKGYNVITSSIEYNEDFFNYEPDKWDILVTNPPWSLSARWALRCFRLGKPFALLLKTDKIQDVGFQKLCIEFGNFEHVHPDTRIDYKMPKKGWATGAQFNTHWYTFGLNIGKEHTYMCPIKSAKKRFKNSLKL